MLGSIAFFRELLDQYMSLRTVTEDCISVHMSTDDLQVAKRNVRDLRRQYGHKLVDKKEFSMDPLNESAEELELVSVLQFKTLLCPFCSISSILGWKYSI